MTVHKNQVGQAGAGVNGGEFAKKTQTDDTVSLAPARADVVSHESREKINAHFYVPNGRSGDLRTSTSDHGQLWEREAERQMVETPRYIRVWADSLVHRVGERGSRVKADREGAARLAGYHFMASGYAIDGLVINDHLMTEPPHTTSA